MGNSNASGSRNANTGNVNPSLRRQLENTFNKYCSQSFYKTVHAEATLMGLMSYLASNDTRVNYGEPIPTDDLQLLKEIIDPVSPPLTARSFFYLHGI